MYDVGVFGLERVWLIKVVYQFFNKRSTKPDLPFKGRVVGNINDNATNQGRKRKRKTIEEFFKK